MHQPQQDTDNTQVESVVAAIGWMHAFFIAIFRTFVWHI